ncbi:AAA family ATPase [Kitasatospora sp. NPDC058190]|uniref:AAA family ATPase n=1 Tax=Kitasatospora sp. NPDC058190 TaxID=3346371 RepID=UPI0036D9D11F
MIGGRRPASIAAKELTKVEPVGKDGLDVTGYPLSPPLCGRAREQEVLDRLLLDLRRGHSRVLLRRGESGVGKTALLTYLAGRAPAGRVVRTVGVETESEIAYSALQQMCAPLLSHLDRLPAAQRAALATALELGLELELGPSDGESPGRLLTGLAVLGLFGRCSTRCCRGRCIPACGTRSSPKHAATRWR